MIFEFLTQNEGQIPAIYNSQISLISITATSAQFKKVRKNIGTILNPIFVYEKYIGTDKNSFTLMEKKSDGFKYFVKSSVNSSVTKNLFRRYDFVNSFSMTEYQVPA